VITHPPPQAEYRGPTIPNRKDIRQHQPQPALNRIQHNGPDAGQTSASAFIRTTAEICRLSIQLEFRWVPGHTGIEGNETADNPAQDAAAPGN
jgi:ribonuclease HI